MNDVMVIVGLIVGFLVWLKITSFIVRKFKQSSGLESLFWLLLLIGTLSFLFGGSKSQTDDYSSYWYGEEEENDLFDCDETFDSCDFYDD